MKMRKLFIFLLALIMVSCGQYEKILKSSDYVLKYKKAKEYYQKGDFVRSATLFEQIQSVYKGTAKADSVDYLNAKSYYGQSDYIMAGHYFKTFTKTYQGTPFNEEAEFMVAYCYYLTSPRPSLDQETTMLAIDAFRMFIIRNPESKRVDECKKLIAELRDKLVEKSYMSAKLYFDMGYYKSSVIALNNSLSEYPDTKYREDLMYFVLKSKYLLAENSILEKQKDRYQATVDEYYSYIGEFPSGKYVKDAQKIYDSSNKITNNK
jgi:outer membrane protein assembly factor BamD